MANTIYIKLTGERKWIKLICEDERAFSFKCSKAKKTINRLKKLAADVIINASLTS